MKPLPPCCGTQLTAPTPQHCKSSSGCGRTHEQRTHTCRVAIPDTACATHTHLRTAEIHAMSHQPVFAPNTRHKSNTWQRRRHPHQSNMRQLTAAPIPYSYNRHTAHTALTRAASSSCGADQGPWDPTHPAPRCWLTGWLSTSPCSQLHSTAAQLRRAPSCRL